MGGYRTTTIRYDTQEPTPSSPASAASKAARTSHCLRLLGLGPGLRRAAGRSFSMKAPAWYLCQRQARYMAGQRGPERLTCRGWPQLGAAPGTPSGAGEACSAPRRRQEGTKKSARASCGAWPVCRHGAAPALELERDALAGPLPVGRRGEGLRREARWLRPRPAGALRRPLSAGSPEASLSARSCLYRLPQASASLGHSSPRPRWPATPG